MKHVHDMPFGARLTEGGGARFRLWAPDAQRMDLVLSAGPGVGECPMQRLPDGWFEAAATLADTSTRYAFRIDGGLVVPDPASRSNPDDVHSPSALVDPLAFDWPDDGWRGRPWHEAVIYELHIGCFTPQGTFAAAMERLDDLVALGITAIELMPVADFPGRCGWGYDGVLQFAPESRYGTPDDLKRLVAAAHQRGLMVLLDVVYNHFGPDGNYLHVYAKPFFNAAVQTPWGAAINFDNSGMAPSPGFAKPPEGTAMARTVRDFFIHNALYWIEEFQMDGLRLDAVHAMHDTSALHFIDELALAVREGPGRTRQVHLVLESDLNDAKRLERDAQGQPRLSDAQWNDDVHHALHVMATGETEGYYTDYATAPQRLFGRALAEGFAFQGDPSAYRAGAPRGTSSLHLPPSAFVNGMQTHDQVGNRAFGERIAALAKGAGREDALRALVACTLLAPSTPMLFMGEEYAASTPFLYFCDFQGELAKGVTEGRRAEFGRFSRFSDAAVRSHIPDPNSASTFAASSLNWSERLKAPHSEWLALYTRLLHLRHTHLMPWLSVARSGRFDLSDHGTLRLTWGLGEHRHWNMVAQLAAHAGPVGLGATLPGTLVYASHPEFDADAALPPWSVRVTLGSP